MADPFPRTSFATLLEWTSHKVFIRGAPMPIVILLMLSVLLTGCYNISTRLQLDDPAVKPELHGEDCSPILFGFGYGANRIERAMRNTNHNLGAPGSPDTAPHPPIKRIHALELFEGQVLFFGQRCIEVTGEP